MTPFDDEPYDAAPTLPVPVDRVVRSDGGARAVVGSSLMALPFGDEGYSDWSDMRSCIRAEPLVNNAGLGPAVGIFDPARAPRLYALPSFWLLPDTVTADNGVGTSVYEHVLARHMGVRRAGQPEE